MPSVLGHAADLHIRGDGRIDPGTGQDRRRRRLEKAWVWVCRHAAEQRVRWFLISGDVFDSPHPEPDDYVVLMRGVRELLGAGIPVIVIPGNHDFEIARGLSHATSPLGLFAREEPRVHVLDRPGRIVVGETSFVGFPHPHRRSLDLDLGAVPVEERVEAVSRAMENVIEQYGERYPGSIALAHLTTVAAQVGAERFMALGWDVSVRPTAFSAYRYAALGHIHFPQPVAPNAWYSGPVERLGFADEVLEPGYLLVDVSSPKPAVERVRYPEATRYLTVSDEQSYQSLLVDSPAGAYVRFRYVPSVGFNAARVALEEVGAAEVIDATESFRTESTPMPEVTGALSPLAALDLYMAKREPPLSPDDVRASLSELVDEVR